MKNTRGQTKGIVLLREVFGPILTRTINQKGLHLNRMPRNIKQKRGEK